MIYLSKLARIVAYIIIVILGSLIFFNGTLTIANLLGIHDYAPFYDFNLPLTSMLTYGGPEYDQILQAIIAISCTCLGFSILVRYSTLIFETVRYFNSDFYILEVIEPRKHPSQKDEHHTNEELIEEKHSKQIKQEIHKHEATMPATETTPPTRSEDIQNDLNEFKLIKKSVPKKEMPTNKPPIKKEIINQEDFSLDEDNNKFAFDVDKFTKTLNVFSAITTPWSKNKKKKDSRSIRIDIE